MFWIFILLATLGLMLIKLGAYSVWVSVLSLAFKFALVVILGFIIIAIWRKMLPKKTGRE